MSEYNYPLNLLLICAFLFLLPFLGACGKLQVNVTDDEVAQEGLNEFSKRIDNAEDHTGQTAPWLQPGIKVVFLKGGNVWLWSSETLRSQRLTSAGGVSDSNLKISDDGRWIAFSRGGDLWLADIVNDERKLVLGNADLEDLIPDLPGVWIFDYDWMPDSHILAFNTRERSDADAIKNNDLHLFDADDFRHTMLFPPGEGGQFHFSPDGSQIALVKPGSITLVNADGSNRRESVLTYTPSRTYAEESYYAEPTWSPDGQSLYVVLLPADIFASPTQFTSVWHISTDGKLPRLIGNLTADPLDRIIISPDGKSAAYLTKPEVDNEHDQKASLILHDLLATPPSEVILDTSSWRIASEWSPDSTRFAYLSGPVLEAEYPELKTATAAGATSAIKMPSDTILLDVRWLDGNHYLTLGRRMDQEIWVLLMGELGGEMIELASIAELPGSDVPPFDFAIDES